MPTPTFHHRSTSPFIVEPNNPDPPRLPPKDPYSTNLASGNTISGGPLRPSTSHSSLAVPRSGIGSDHGTYLDAQIYQPRAYRSHNNSPAPTARSSTFGLGAPVAPVRRSTSPFSDTPDDAALADALRDSVIIGSDHSPTPSDSGHFQHRVSSYEQKYNKHTQTQPSQLIDLDETLDHPSTGQAPPQTRHAGSLYQPNMPSHAYSHSTSGLPNAPSANMAAEQRERSKPRASLQNPFEADEIDPAELEKQQQQQQGQGAARVKFGRSQTSQTTGTSGAAQGNEAAGGAPSRTRARRAMSNDSYNPEKDAATREIIAGQRKAPEDKKGSKHADVIDQWDLTGLGKAMWHHSGPYDAAAPSRNINAPRGPMSAFRRPGEPRPSASNSPAKADPAAPPPDDEKPEKPEKESTRPRDEPKRIAVQRAGSSRAGGGLTGQYSSSVPSGGAYFPEVDEPTNEAELARMDRLREKEMKRRALKAAWGVDEPEPFEAFGFSPNEGPMEMDDTFSPNTQNAALPSTKPLRSPGLRLGLGSSTPPIKEGSASPTHGYFADGAGPTTGVGTGTAKPAGVKRTKSLMQRIKSMREQKTAIPFRSASPSKAAHPSSPTAEYPFPAGTASGNGSNDSSGNSSPAKKEREREAAPTMKLVTRSYPNDEGYQFADADEIPAASLNDDFVFAHSPTKTSSGAGSATTTNTNGHHRKKSSYSPSADAPPVPSVPATYGAQRSNSSNNTTAKDTERDPHRALMSRVKNLPAPPVAQVMPDFDDLMGPRGFASTGGMRSANRDPRDEDAIVEEDVPEPYSEVREKPYGGMRRKPSMVKKIKDKIVK